MNRPVRNVSETGVMSCWHALPKDLNRVNIKYSAMPVTGITRGDGRESLIGSSTKKLSSKDRALILLYVIHKLNEEGVKLKSILLPGIMKVIECLLLRRGYTLDCDFAFREGIVVSDDIVDDINLMLRSKILCHASDHITINTNSQEIRIWIETRLKEFRRSRKEFKQLTDEALNEIRKILKSRKGTIDVAKDIAKIVHRLSLWHL